MLAEFGNEQSVKKKAKSDFVPLEGLKQVPELPDNNKMPPKNDINPQQKTTKTFIPQSFISKIKKIKNFEIYLAVALILIMVVIYLTTIGGGPSASNGKSSWQRSNEDVYARELESKLVSTLSAVKGAGKVNAMVTVTGSATLEIAYNIEEKSVTQSGAGGNATTTTTIIKTPVIVNGGDGPQPLIILEIKPQLKGVVIVASGAWDVGVRLQLLRAVQVLIADDSVRIEILTGK